VAAGVQSEAVGVGGQLGTNGGLPLQLLQDLMLLQQQLNALGTR
jgi:hypothetical protein